MSLVVNHNMMAANVARNLNTHYANLATSTQRLSTGMRINSAADDAAGLAIRELMRADIASLQQGARNANDAISMIQTADGAFSVIDEKLIRMKELAEQAATGTYDSTQRMMIENEYQAMAAEITRIALATDFNGIHLLDGSLQGEHDGSGVVATGKMKVHFGTGNDSAEDYYYVEIPESTSAAFGIGNSSTWQDASNRLWSDLYTNMYTELSRLESMGDITDDIKSSIKNAANSWLDEFKTQLMSHVPPTAADATKYATYPEVQKLGTFPSNISTEPEYVQQRWNYAIGHAILDDPSFYGSFSVPTLPGGVTVSFNPLKITDSPVALTMTDGTATEAGGALLTYDENGNITSITGGTGSSTFIRNVQTGEYTYISSPNTITYNEDGKAIELFDGSNTTNFTTGIDGRSYPAKVVTADNNVYDIQKNSTYPNLIEGITTDGGDVVALVPAYDITTGKLNGTIVGTLNNPSYAYSATVTNGSVVYPTIVNGPSGVSHSEIAANTYAFVGEADAFGGAITSGTLNFHANSELVADDGTNTITFDSTGNFLKIVNQNPVSNLSTAYILSRDGAIADYVYEESGIKYYYNVSSGGSTFVQSVDAYGNVQTPPAFIPASTITSNFQILLRDANTAEASYRAYKLITPVKNSINALSIAEDAFTAANNDPPFTDAQTCATIVNNSKNAVKIGSAIENILIDSIDNLDSLKYNYAGFTIQTQEDAQITLAAINDAIVAKDKIRADLGALQNRFENTIMNLNTQAENLQAAESRISDVDVSTEMTEFVRQQILSQSAVAMLAQANSLPQMAMQVIGG